MVIKTKFNIGDVVMFDDMGTWRRGTIARIDTCVDADKPVYVRYQIKEIKATGRSTHWVNEPQVEEIKEMARIVFDGADEAGVHKQGPEPHQQ